jgi:peptidoglycan glycosyltransferase
MRMLRREAIAALVGAALPAHSHAAIVLVDMKTGRVTAVEGAALAERLPAPPGSAIKPFTLAALMEAGKLKADESFPCPGRLTIGGRAFPCSHPRVGAVRLADALSYSCNCFVAHVAERFTPGELAGSLERAGISQRVRPAGDREASQLQAIGEGSVLVTATELALAYRRLAMNAPEPILSGLEGAVEFGTAQRARIAGVTSAGKTGSVRASDGAFLAWFAGFAPSRAPVAVVTVLLQGRSGGADAAPIGGRILAERLAGKI